MIDVHDIVAHFQITKVGKKSCGARASSLFSLDSGAAAFECRFGSFVEQIAFDLYHQMR